MWSHKGWKSLLCGASAEARLAAYAEAFDTVEGNTTFYALPSGPAVAAWDRATPDDFRFTFKLPSHITHELALSNCQKEVNDFFRLMTPLLEKTAIWKIQLPARFGPESLPLLSEFLALLPAGIGLGVEVRHRAFFAKGEAERSLNRMLIDKGVNRIIMDTRPVFALPPVNEAVIDAQQKKPRVPVHPIATAFNPVVRFIGQPHTLQAWGCEPVSLGLPTGRDNQGFFLPWKERLKQWLAEGRSPYLFIHTPDNSDAPELAAVLVNELCAAVNESGTVAKIWQPERVSKVTSDTQFRLDI
ncbi:DUF72 domain-containing protein [Shewanella sp.]|uniref:DUF72 domain-containing protein n=1 Tax=Shewanella sp. TaxID=50422 RepID=UPI003564A2E3